MSRITIQNLSKKFGSQYALRNVSIEVKPGSVTALLGPNGAGKSTLMRILCGIEKPTKGTVLIDGQKLSSLPRPVSQIGALLSPEWLDQRLTCGNVLTVQGALLHQHLSRSEVMRRLEEVGLEAARRKRVRELSLGMRQRLALAVALLGHPKILILDEPVNGLDPEGVRWVRDLLKDYQKNDGTVLISSHLIAEVSLAATDIIVIEQGVVLFSGSMQELTADTQRQVHFQAETSMMASNLLSLAQAVGYRTGNSESQTEGIIYSASSPEIFKLAASNDIVLTRLQQLSEGLEDAYLDKVHTFRGD